jgi:hypothetical protein
MSKSNKKDTEQCAIPVVNSRYLWFTDYIEVPNGTYVDKMGRVKMSYLVRTPQGERYAAPKYDLE